MNRLNETLSRYGLNIQTSLFPWLAEELGPLTMKQQELITILELIRIEEFGGRAVRVRGHAKVMCHFMFGVLALTANQLLSFVT